MSFRSDNIQKKIKETILKEFVSDGLPMGINYANDHSFELYRMVQDDPPPSALFTIEQDKRKKELIDMLEKYPSKNFFIRKKNGAIEVFSEKKKDSYLVNARDLVRSLKENPDVDAYMMGQEIRPDDLYLHEEVPFETKNIPEMEIKNISVNPGDNTVNVKIDFNEKIEDPLLKNKKELTILFDELWEYGFDGRDVMTLKKDDPHFVQFVEKKVFDDMDTTSDMGPAHGRGLY